MSKKCVYSIFIFRFSWDPPLKKLVWLYIYIQFSISVSKKYRIWIQKLNTIFWCFHFLEIEYIHFRKKPNLWVPLTLICPIKKHSLFQFVGPTIKKLVWLYIYIQFSISVSKKYRIWIQKLNTTFWCFHFFEIEYSDIFIKNQICGSH